MTTPSGNARLEQSLWDRVWIVIPAFNEAKTIRELAERALVECPRVIVVDDGSTDGTADQLRDLPITLLTHVLNQGKAACLRRAFVHALDNEAACIISMDGDSQHDPADASRLLSVWRSWSDHIVVGTRLHDRENFPASRYYANRVACFWISWACGQAIIDTQSGFRVYPKDVMRIALGTRVNGQGFVFESELLIEAARQGLRTVGVPIAGRYPADARPSHFRPVVDISKIVLMVGSRLLRQGLAPLGLYRSLQPALVITEKKAIAIDSPHPSDYD